LYAVKFAATKGKEKPFPSPLESGDIHGMLSMKTIYIEQICKPCADKLGWVPVPYAVGMWPGQCEVCDKQARLAAPRDYRMPDGHWVNPEVEIED